MKRRITPPIAVGSRLIDKHGSISIDILEPNPPINGDSSRGQAQGFKQGNLFLRQTSNPKNPTVLN